MILVGVTNYNKQSALPLLLIEDLLSSQCLGLDISSWLSRDFKLAWTEISQKKKKK